MKKSAALSRFEQASRSEIQVQNVRPIMPDTSAPPHQISRTFINQSFFDDVLLERAILPQRQNEPIVASTLRPEQTPGYAVGLHPSSETPVAVQFTLGGQPTSSQALTLRPGQIVRPHGLPRGMHNGSFSGFNWGLPFGWLGGGLATLFVFQTPDSDVSWPGNAEVAFHHSRYEIVAPAALVGGFNAPKNWPIRFPWTQALQGPDSLIQRGQAVMAIAKPTRLIMRLRLPTLADQTDMRIIFQGTNDFDRAADGSPILSPVGFIDFTWPSYASVGAGPLGTQFPYFELEGPAIRLGADDGGIQLVDMSAGGDVLAGAFVDITRFGHLG